MHLFVDFLIIIWRLYFFIVILRHYGSIVIVNMKRLKAMSEKELEIFRNKVRAGLLEAERNIDPINGSSSGRCESALTIFFNHCNL